MKDELKKEKYPDGAFFYVINYSENDKKIYRIGITGNLNSRK